MVMQVRLYWLRFEHGQYLHARARSEAMPRVSETGDAREAQQGSVYMNGSTGSESGLNNLMLPGMEV